jgi:hypothetical protein
MDLTKILAVSGKPGLFKVLSQTKNGFIVESLTDGKRFPVFSHERASSLQEISIFSTGEDLPLKDVLKKMNEKLGNEKAPDAKSEPAVIQGFFAEVVPDYDKERVHLSDMKKVITWYNILAEKDMLDFTEEEQEKAEEPVKEEDQPVKEEDQPVKE